MKNYIESNETGNKQVLKPFC